MRMSAPNIAAPERYPVIISRDPTNTGRVDRPTYKKAYPTINERMGGITALEKPHLSYIRPYKAVMTEATITAGAIIST